MEIQDVEMSNSKGEDGVRITGGGEERLILILNEREVLTSPYKEQGGGIEEGGG